MIVLYHFFAKINRKQEIGKLSGEKRSAYANQRLSVGYTFQTAGIYTACKFITVDAIPSAIPFYHKYGFVFLTSKDRKPSTRLIYYELKN